MVAAGPTKLAKKTTVFDTRTWFRAKVAAEDVNRKKPSVFDTRILVSCERLLPDQPNCKKNISF
jgi:hypothetical protein